MARRANRVAIERAETIDEALEAISGHYHCTAITVAVEEARRLINVREADEARYGLSECAESRVRTLFRSPTPTLKIVITRLVALYLADRPALEREEAKRRPAPGDEICTQY